MNTALKLLLSTILIFFTYLMVSSTIPYFSFETDIDFLLTKQSILYNKIWLVSFYLHIGASPIILAAGIIQFNNYFLSNYRAVHKFIGKTYVMLVLFISAPSGLIMAVYANGGIWAKISFVLISILWWYFTWRSYSEIIKKNIASHQNFMLRSYALTLSAITLRIYTFAIPQFVHIRGVEFYILVAWLSWLPNLAVAEWLIRKRKNK